MTTMLTRLLILLIYIYTQRSFCNGSEMSSYANALQSLDTILKSYDARNIPRPQSGNGNVTVETNFYLRDILEVDERNMEFTVQMTFQQKWLDKRLAFDSSKRYNVKMITLKYEDYGKKIWTPDTFIVNSVKGNRHDIVEPNNYLRIFPDGQVLYSERLTATMSCPMDLSLYPVGSQRCHLKIASYAYQQTDVRYVWKSQDPIQVTQSLTLKGGYVLDVLQDVPFKARNADLKTSTGVYSVLEAELKFNRLYSYDVLTVYVPWTMIIVISWSSFWIDPKGPSSAARFMIVTICLLYASYDASKLNSKLPKVAYTKMIDVWTGICVTILFFTFKHSVLIHYFTRFDNCGERKEHGKPTRSCRPGCCSKPWHEWLDAVARIVYPALFVVFATFYWIHMGRKIKEEYGRMGVL